MPTAVDGEWRTFFEALAEQKSDVLAEVRGASWAPNGARVIGAVDPETLPSPANRNVKANGAAATAAPAQIAGKTEADIRAAALDTSRAFLLIRSYRIRGHLEADLDPLGLVRQALHRELDPATYGFGDGRLGPSDPDLRGAGPGRIARPCARSGTACARPTAARSASNTCTSPIPTRRRGSRSASSTSRTTPSSPPEGRRMILERVVEAEGLERYLGVKFVGTKRFGLDGGESLIPGIEQILKRGGQLGIRDVVIGMPHRGRLNTLVHVLHKSYTALFSEFQGRSSQPEEMRGSGDVKYHLGASADREFDGTTIHLSLSPNPSHLEAVNPVVLGKARAKQDQRGDTERSQVMAILMHGDAAFAGQGLVAESLDLSRPRRLPHRRHHPFRGQQPDRLHDAADLLALRPLLHRDRQDRAGADPARERRRPRGRGPRLAHRHRVSASTSSATSSSTCSATAGTATTSRTSRCSPSR